MSLQLDQHLQLDLRCVFLGRPNRFNDMLARWLGRQMRLVGIVWSEPNRETWSWRKQWLKRSLSRGGTLKTLDQVRFRLWAIRNWEGDRAYCHAVEDLRALLPEPNDRAELDCPVLRCDDVNSPAALEFVHSVKPNIAFVHCFRQYIRPALARLPSHGTFVLHDGVTPEYRGVHTTYWPLANGEDNRVGYSLLKCDEKIDGGPVYAQGVTGLPALATPLAYLHHAVVMEGLPAVSERLTQLAEGTAKPIDTSGRRHGYYSYFQHSALRKILARRKERGVPVSFTPKTDYVRLTDL